MASHPPETTPALSSSRTQVFAEDLGPAPRRTRLDVLRDLLYP